MSASQRDGVSIPGAVGYVGGSIVGGDQNIHGFTAAQVQELTKAAVAGAVAPLADRMAELSQRLGVTQGAALAILRSLGHDDVPVERLPDMLAAVAMQILAMRQALTRPNNDESEIAGLKRQAVSALDTGAFDEATRLLNIIRERERETSERRRRAAEESRADWLAGLQAEAETCTLLARAALAQRDVAAAHARFEEGLQVLAPADPETRWSYALTAAGALYDLGDRAGLNEALTAAIRLYRLGLADAARERTSLDWAKTQNNLGVALATLGERESGTVRLDEAVAAYRAALKECTRERDPLQWAETQMNLGNALASLGERERGTARLAEAVAAYRAALEEYTRERDPLQWAMVQHNFGNALRMLGERERGTARLVEAVVTLRGALEERTRERNRLHWAMTQMNLGNALVRLGERERGTARLIEAVAVYHAALEEYTRERVPFDWALTQMNLGSTLAILGTRERGTARLVEAVAAYRAALDQFRNVGAHYTETVRNGLQAAETALSARCSGRKRHHSQIIAGLHRLKLLWNYLSKLLR